MFAAGNAECSGQILVRKADSVMKQLAAYQDTREQFTVCSVEDATGFERLASELEV